MLILPRQARDKHRESTQKQTVLLRSIFRRSVGVRLVRKETLFGAVFPESKRSFAKTGSGHTGGRLKTLCIYQRLCAGNYGVLPNAIMPRTFLAQTYDLNDPWAGAK